MSARELQQDLRRLVGLDQAYAPLDPIVAVGARTGGVSVGRAAGSDAGEGGGEVVFAESDYSLRQYWPERIAATSSDGLFVILDEPIKQIALEGEQVATFQEPTG